MTFQTFTGKQYLQIDIANNFGLDQETWDERLIWFHANEAILEDIIKEAKEPALYFAGVQAWRKCKAEKPISYPISLDATSSGIQLLAALTGDRKASELCNLVDTGKREDAYTGLYQSMLNKIDEKAKINRKDTKNAIMTAFYSSTAVPKRIFGEGPLLNAFFETMSEEAPGAWELTETMLAIWNPNKYSNDWIMPDNFHVQIKVMNTITETVNFMNQPFDIHYSVNEPMEGGRSLGANMVHSIDGMLVREMTRRCDYDEFITDNIIAICESSNTYGTRTDRTKDKLTQTLWEHYLDSKFLSARILDHLDYDNMGLVDHKIIIDLIKSLPKKPFEILAVHDCFRCLPNYGNDLRKQYNILMSNIAKSNLLSFIISQLMNKIVPVSKIDSNLWKDILDTNYALS